MTRIKSEQDFRELVLKHLPDLPPQQQQVAEYMLSHLPELPFLSVPVLSQRIKVSEATVVRFAQRIGYDGFTGMKMDLMEALKERVTGNKDELPALLTEVRENDTLAAAGVQEIHNIRRTIQHIPKDQFLKSVSALFKADHIYTFGLGVSAHLAELFSYQLIQIGLRASTITPKSSSPLEQLVPLRLTDLLVVFSFPPYSKATIGMVENTRSRGIPNLAICDKLSAPVVKDAKHVLTVATENMMFTNALGGVVMLMNALVTEIAVRHGDAVEAVSKINEILENDKNLIANGEAEA